MWNVPQTPDETSRLRIFVSYAWSDATWAADLLLARCIEQGHEVWLDRQEIRGGYQLHPAIHTALDWSDVVLAILSPNSYGSPNCNLERDYASTKHKWILPIILDEKPEVLFDLKDVIWRKIPTQIVDLLADLAILASQVTPGQLGPGLGRLSTAVLSHQQLPSMLFARKEATSSIIQFISEVNALALLLAPLREDLSGTAIHSHNNNSLALKLVQSLLPNAIRGAQIGERQVSSLLRRFSMRSDLIDGALLKSLAGQIISATSLIMQNRQFAEDPDRMFGDSGLSVIYSILTLNKLQLNHLLLFQHRGLDAAVSVLRCVGADGELVADAMFNVLVSQQEANTKTIVAHLARRFPAFGDRVGNDWEKLVKRAVTSTVGSDQDRLDIEHNVVYAGSMHGSKSCIDNIMTIEGDTERLEAIVAFNKRIVSPRDFDQILKMLNRKATCPQPDEAWVAPWAGRLFNILKE